MRKITHAVSIALQATLLIPCAILMMLVMAIRHLTGIDAMQLLEQFSEQMEGAWTPDTGVIGIDKRIKERRAPGQPMYRAPERRTCIRRQIDRIDIV
jgi:hypothetical protein